MTVMPLPKKDYFQASNIQGLRSVQQVSMREITIRLTDNEYQQYVKKGQSEYRMRMKKDMEDEEYVK
jgi:hypothetical protein